MNMIKMIYILQYGQEKEGSPVNRKRNKKSTQPAIFRQ